LQNLRSEVRAQLGSIFCAHRAQAQIALDSFNISVGEGQSVFAKSTCFWLDVKLRADAGNDSFGQQGWMRDSYGIGARPDEQEGARQPMMVVMCRVNHGQVTGIQREIAQARSRAIRRDGREPFNNARLDFHD
jgi:hypothetical protein